MNDDNTNETEEALENEGEGSPKLDAASRARNKTVMLTPEVTGQLRALLNREEGEQSANTSSGDPLSDLLPPVSWSDSPVEETQPEVSTTAPEAAQSPEPEEPAPLFSGAETVVRTAGESFSRPQAPAFQPRPQTPMSTSKPAFTVNNPSVATANRFQRPQPAQAPDTKIIGFLVSFDKNKNGEVFEIRAGRWLLTSRPTEHGDFILIDDDSISSLHAIIRATKDGKIQVLDQLSEHGTGLFSVGSDDEQEVAGSLVSLSHGDLIRFGKRFFAVCIIPEVDLPEAAEED